MEKGRGDRGDPTSGDRSNGREKRQRGKRKGEGGRERDGGWRGGRKVKGGGQSPFISKLSEYAQEALLVAAFEEVSTLSQPRVGQYRCLNTNI